MRALCDGDRTNTKEEFKPDRMQGYRYLVYGETKQRGFKLKKPQYALSTDQTAATTQQKTSPLVTLNMIWDYGKDGRDLSLAFALSRLLRCRLEDVKLDKDVFKINRKLVNNLIGEKADTSYALKIMEMQIAFVHDYFNTRYPMVFWRGLPSLFFNLFLSVLTIGAVGWLAVDIRKVYKPPSGELANLVKGFNVDMIITWVFISLMIVKELWEMHTYLQSDWTSLIKGCEYVHRKSKRTNDDGSSDDWLDRILQYFTRAKITDRRWHGFIDQYVFVQSYDDRPRFWNLIHNLTTGIVPKKHDGAALSSAIKVPDYVKKAVLKKLGNIIEDKSDYLPSFIETLSNDSLRKQLQNYKAYTAQPRSTHILMPSSTKIVLPTCSDIVLPTSSCIVAPANTKIVLPTSSHIILVWHIATSMCEMELATKHGVNLSKPGFPCSLLSWLTSCCSSKQFLIDVSEKKDSIGSSCFTNCCLSKSNDKLCDELREAYVVVNSLSRYCAYLLVSKPDMIPDSFLVPNIVFQKTVKSAYDGILKDCDSLMKRYRNLKDEAEKPIKVFENEDVLKQGVALGKELLNHPTDEGRWKILAEVWTELLIHMAPTTNAQAHRKCLSGGEFITHIWALLWHHGIQKSRLWPKDVGPENNGPPVLTLANDSDCAGNERNQSGQAEMSSNQIGIIIDEENDNKGRPKGDEASTSRTGPWRMEKTRSSEIEKISHHETVESINVHRGPVEQAPNQSQAKKVE